MLCYQGKYFGFFFYQLENISFIVIKYLWFVLNLFWVGPLQNKKAL